jgi:hypothetical protein
MSADDDRTVALDTDLDRLDEFEELNDRATTPPVADPPDEWSRLSGGFVDEPEQAVQAARRLVEQDVESLLSEVAARSAASGETATEEFRVAFRRYREIHRALSGLAEPAGQHQAVHRRDTAGDVA